MTYCSPLTAEPTERLRQAETMALSPIGDLSPLKTNGTFTSDEPVIGTLSYHDRLFLNRDELFAEFQPLVRRLIRQYGADNAEFREDLAGEIYYRFCRLLEVYDPERGVPLRPYLVRQLTASVYTFARHQWRQKRREVYLETGEGALEVGPTIDPTAEWDRDLATQHVMKALPAGIAKLPQRQRQVLVWRYYEQRGFEDIAEMLEIQQATARSMLRHALNNLRKWIAANNLEWE
jgi:RNA polymerase sigma factor (sigma-70 family)